MDNIENIKIDFKVLSESKNINELLTEAQSDAIAHQVIEDFRADKSTRSKWEKANEHAMKLALQVAESKTLPWEGASNVKFPLLSQAALQFQVRAFSNLAQAPDLVRMKVTGADPKGTKAARASRVSQHMSYQNLDEDPDWESGFDRMLMVLPIMGLCFRKKFWDASEQRLKTTTVLPQNLVVPYRAASLETMPRKTEMFYLYDREVKSRQLRKVYSDVKLGQADIPEPDNSDIRAGVSNNPSDTKLPRMMLEQHLWLDLDGDGYPEPYIVTVDSSDVKTLRIVNRFRKVISEQSEQISVIEDELAGFRRKAHELIQQVQQKIKQMQEAGTPPNVQDQQAVEQQVGQIEQEIDIREQRIKELADEPQNILEILPIESYTKYSFIPAPDGSFYDIGFGSLLAPLNGTVNTLINQLIDAGTLQTTSGGFLGRGARIKGGKVSFRNNEWIKINSTGQSLKESIVPIPVNSPSPVLFNLLGLLIEYTKELSSINDAMSGKNMGQNTPAYNMEAMLSQGMQVFSGIFKRVHRSMRQEFREQYRLNSVYLNPEEYFETLEGKAQVLSTDYTGDGKDIHPAADKNAFSSQEKMQKAQMLLQRADAVAGYDKTKIELRFLEAMSIADSQEVFPINPETGQPAIEPPKNPEFEIQVMELQHKVEDSKQKAIVAMMGAEDKNLLTQAQVAKLTSEAQAIGDNSQVSQFKAVTERLKVKQEKIRDKLKELESGKSDTKQGSDG